MIRLWTVAWVLLAAGSLRTHGAEERIRGVLEKTARPNACAQITDALNDVYYVVKTVESEKVCAPLIGQRVVLTGTVEEHAEDRSFFLTLKHAEVYQPKQPDKPTDTPTTAPLPPPPTGETKKAE